MEEPRSLRCVFEPRRVVLVGASAREGSPGNVLWRNLATFPGDVVPVSRTAEAIDGQRTYRSLRDVPGTIDLAVVAVPAAATLDVVRDAVAANVGACVLVSAGFAETGPDGRALQEELVRAAREGGVLLVGPNCLGVQNCDLPLNASLAAGAASGGGGISLITQSGSYAMALHSLSTDDGVGFAVAYSAGNRADINDFEVVAHLCDDPNTRVICAFIESLPEGRAFLDVARRSTPVKPLVVTAVGRSEAGVRAAASHTAALAADRRTWDDLLSCVGVTVTHSGLEMLDAARVLRGQPLPRGVRAGIVTNSGGTGTELADLLAEQGVVVPQLSDALREQLAALLPPYGSAGNPVDVTPAWARFAELYPAVVDALARSGEVDLIVPVLLHRSAEDPAVAEEIARTVEQLRSDGNAVPVYVCWVARRSAWPNSATLHAVGVPCLEWPERTARAVGHAVRYAAFQRGAAAEAPEPESGHRSRTPLPDAADVAATCEFLAHQGIPVVETLVRFDVDGAVQAAGRLGYPVVLKVDHPNLSHKSDVGGVRLGLADEAAVTTAARELLALADRARLLVQTQRSGLEVVVGGLQEPTFGPVVTFGLGGVLVEVLHDVSFAPAPLSTAAALRLLDMPRGSAMLDGVRGAAPVDRAAIAALIRSVGDLMSAYPDLRELDLNPVLAGPDACIAVDFRIVVDGEDPRRPLTGLGARTRSRVPLREGP